MSSKKLIPNILHRRLMLFEGDMIVTKTGKICVIFQDYDDSFNIPEAEIPTNIGYIKQKHFGINLGPKGPVTPELEDEIREKHSEFFV